MEQRVVREASSQTRDETSPHGGWSQALLRSFLVSSDLICSDIALSKRVIRLPESLTVIILPQPPRKYKGYMRIAV